MSAALTTNVDQRLLRTTKFPPEFNVKVDMEKVEKTVIKTWAQNEISRILKSDDDVVAELVSNVLDEKRYPNIKELQISLTGFLDKDAAPFCQQLWKLCISAQESPSKVPKELIEAKKAELAQEKIEEDKAREEATKREDAERNRERELARIRERERDSRSWGRRGRSPRGFDRRSSPRDSRSPPPRRRRDDDDFYRAPPRADTYIPSRTTTRRHRRSPSYDRASSPSRSPAPRRKRRNTSSERSTSSDRNSNSKKRRRKEYCRRSRSPDRQRQSSSSARDRRNPRRTSTGSRSTPPKKTSQLASDDLMANKRKDNSDNLRLSRQSDSPGDEVGIE